MMTNTHKAIFNDAKPVEVPSGTTITEAAQLAGVAIHNPCGAQGRCGRCVVQVRSGEVHQRAAERLSAEDLEQGFVLACQTTIESDVSIYIPPQEKVERRLVTDLTARKVEVPAGYDYRSQQTTQRFNISLDKPSLEDQTDDWSRLQRALRQVADIEEMTISLPLLRQLGTVLRDGEWEVSAIINTPPEEVGEKSKLIALYPIHFPEDKPLWGVSVDIGTTTVTVWLVDLVSGEVKAQASEYNQQIHHGEDVISRIIFSAKDQNEAILRRMVLETINKLIVSVCRQVKTKPEEIYKATIAGNSTMVHLLLGIPAVSIRLSPFITAINQVPRMTADEIGLNIYPESCVDILPGIASYVGSDITSGTLSSGIADADKTTLFLDVGTNGEMVLGTSEWLVACACSAGPAFEGAGVVNGMRATKGAIEEVWVNNNTHEPTIRVIGGGEPRGLCGSGLISLLAELFLSGVVDKSGNVITSLDTPRVRTGEHGGEYVVAWADETSHGKDIVITHVDIDNLLRAKAAIFAGFVVLAESVGMTIEDIQQILIGGSFGQYINVEKAIQIGLLPDLKWENFHFLGNTSVLGAYFSLLSADFRSRIENIAMQMTYIELSADNKFYDAFMSALFLPHTDLTLFPTVAQLTAGT
jgi:uncharacterized 2Fe-2S/4Fe-4S cluster protein (DUF4445 family)